MKKQAANLSSNDSVTNPDFDIEKETDLVHLKGDQKLYLHKNSDILILGDIFHFKQFNQMIKEKKFDITNEEKNDLYRDIAERIKDNKELKVINQQISEEEFIDSDEKYCIEHESDFNALDKIFRKNYEYLYPSQVFGKCVLWRFNRTANYKYYSRQLDEKNKFFFCKISVGNNESRGNSKINYKTARINAIELFYSKFIPEIYDILFKINKSSQINILTPDENSSSRNQDNNNLKPLNNKRISNLEKEANPSDETSNKMSESAKVNLSYSSSNETKTENLANKQNNKSCSSISSLTSSSNSRQSDKKSSNKKEAKIMLNKMYESDYSSQPQLLIKSKSNKISSENLKNNLIQNSSSSETSSDNASYKNAKEKLFGCSEQSDENSSTNHISHNKNKDNIDHEEIKNKKMKINSYSDLDELNSIVQSEFSVFSFQNPKNSAENVSNEDYYLNNPINKTNLDSKKSELFLVDLTCSGVESLNQEDSESDASKEKPNNKRTSVIKNDKKAKVNKNADKVNKETIFLELKENDAKKFQNKSNKSLIGIERKNAFNSVNYSAAENINKKPKENKVSEESKKLLSNIQKIPFIDEREKDFINIKINNEESPNIGKKCRNAKLLFKTQQIIKDPIDITSNFSETSMTNFEKQIEIPVSNFNSKEGIELITKSLSKKSNTDLKQVNCNQSNDEKPNNRKISSVEIHKTLKNPNNNQTKIEKKEKSKSSSKIKAQINIKEMMSQREKTETIVIDLERNTNETFSKDNKILPSAKNNSKSCVSIALVKSKENLNGSKITSSLKEKSVENSAQKEEKPLLNKKRVRKEDENNYSENKSAGEENAKMKKSSNKAKSKTETVESQNEKEDKVESKKEFINKKDNAEKIKEIKNKITNNKSKANDSDSKKETKKLNNKTTTAAEKNNSIRVQDKQKKYKFDQKNILNLSNAVEEINLEINLSLYESSKEDNIKDGNQAQEDKDIRYDFIDFYKKSGLVKFKKNDINVINYPYSLELEKNYKPKSLLETYLDKKHQLKDKFQIKIEFLDSRSSNKNLYIGYFNDIETGKYVETEPMESYFKASQRINQLLLSEIFCNQTYYWEIVEKIQLM